MSELERAIENWKHGGGPDGSLGDSEIEEIESHLRDSIVALQAKGLSEQEAFLVGVHRLGQLPELVSEFEKNWPCSATSRRVAWMLGGYLGISICRAVVHAIVSVMTAVMALAGWDAVVTGGAVVAIQVIGWGCLGALVYRVIASGSVKLDRCTIKMVAGAGASLVALAGIAAIARAVVAQSVSAVWLGQSSVWLAFSSMAVHASVYAICLVTIYRVAGAQVRTAE